MNKNTKIQENKAITLIALVITIIVLIILTGVAINLAFGQNGLVAKAKQASENYRIAKEKEELELEIVDIQTQTIKEEGRIATLQDLYNKIDKLKYTIELSNKEIANLDSTIANPTYALVNKIESNIYFTVDKKLEITKVEVKGKVTQKEEIVKVSNITWSNGKATVELATKETGTIEYKIGENGIYQTGTAISNLNNGDIVYTRVNNNGTYTDEEQKEIKDTILPEKFEITTSDLTYEKVKLKGNTQDNQTGIAKYSYVAATKTNEIVQEITDQTVTEYTITDLAPETEYIVYMLAYDKAGNVRKSNEVTVTTTSMKKFRQVDSRFGGNYVLDEEGNIYQLQINRDAHTPILIADKNYNFVKMSVGGQHYLAIDENGNLYSWGSNTYGELGLSSAGQYPTPTKIMEGTKFIEICAGYTNSFAIDEEGNLYFSGDSEGVLYDVRYQYGFVKIEAGVKFKKISIDMNYALALDVEGHLWTWGSNQYGKLGDGATYDDCRYRCELKKIVENVKFNEICAGRAGGAAIDENGNIWSWGENKIGQVGEGTISEYIATPVKITSNINFVKVQMDRTYRMVLSDEGDIYVCGRFANKNYSVPTRINEKTKYKDITYSQDAARTYSINQYGKLCYIGLPNRAGSLDLIQAGIDAFY